MNKTRALVIVFSLFLACSEPKKQLLQEPISVAALQTTPIPSDSPTLEIKEVRAKTTPTPKATKTKKAEETKLPLIQKDSDIDSSFKQKELEAKAAIALSKHTTLKIVWGMPKSPADFFIIDYGFSKNSLNRRLKINTKNLKSEAGYYSYQLPDVPKDQAVYFTIQSINKSGRSVKSAVHMVKPSSKR